MNKYINIAIVYAILGGLAGVFYREFTKYNNYTAETMLSKAHAHLLVLGMMLFLVVAIFVKIDKNIEKKKKFKTFIFTYNIGLIITVGMMIAKGILEVLSIPLVSKQLSIMAGIAGVGHILLFVGILLLLSSFKIKESDIR